MLAAHPALAPPAGQTPAPQGDTAPPAARPASPAETALAAPPAPASPSAAPTAAPAAPADQTEGTGAPAARSAVPIFTRHAAGAPISPVDPALLVQSTLFPDRQLPRIAPDGRMPMQVYAGGFDMADTRPKVGLLLAGIGQSDVYSDDASRLLPPGVTFAVSPYANQPSRLLDGIRARGHEFLVSIPMEPQGAPVNDAGPQSLLTGAAFGQNVQRLEWALSRFNGYAGATSALDGLRGERFSSSPSQLDPVLDLLAKSGLFYVDATPATLRTPPFQTTRVPARAIDIVIDEPAVRVEIEKKLQTLEQIAKDRGSAIGLAGLPRPVTIDRIAAWSNGLAAHGLVLAPVSVLVLQPTPPDSAASAAHARAP